MGDGRIMGPGLNGGAAAAISFLLLGTVAALWENPVFVRMTPAGNLEIVLLGAMSLLLGVYVAIRRPACSIRTAGAGGVRLAICGRAVAAEIGSRVVDGIAAPPR